MTNRTALLLILVLLLGWACASAPPPATQDANEPPPPAEPVNPVMPETPEPPPVEEGPAERQPPVQPESQAVVEPVDEVEGAYGARTVMITSPDEKVSEKPTLAEAARRAREKRDSEAQTSVVITDDNLSEYATGELSIAEEDGTQKASTEPDPASTAETAESEEKGEAYWRNRVRDARLEWKELVDQIDELEAEVGELRQRFYAEDDGFYRDSQIKPEWDRAIDRLREVRDEVDIARQKLAQTLEEGRQAGALPGWLREGIELEPRPEGPRDELPEHQVVEPTIVPEDGDDG